MSPSLVGQTLGHYRIESKLGEGGMGAVWKARDTRLDRFVALKTLPAEKLADPERRRRFVEEAKSASALNHPNIVHIYDIADADAVPFIAMEYVAGKTLDQLIGRKGLRLGEVLKHAVQIADAIARAHSAGIIHRDLKPSNIMVDEHGLVKVLDFGLAKLTETSTGEFGETETVRVPSGPDTKEGTIVGTVAYMSPEQAEGKIVDARSDIFSFGSVLYEMVTGQHAFRGDSKLSTLSAILKEEPKPVASIMPDVPRDLEKIINRCLRKDPARRVQTMADLNVALTDLKEESESGSLAGGSRATPASGKMRWKITISAVALLSVVAVAAVWFYAQSSRPATPLKIVPLTSYPGSELTPSFSPDGNQVAFSWNGENQDNYDIYVKLLDGGRPLRLTTNPAPDTFPAWSPDGRQIAFIRNAGNAGAIFLISPLGGPERRLTDARTRFKVTDTQRLFNTLAWTPDGKSLAFTDCSSDKEAHSVFLISTVTGETRRLTSPSASFLGDLMPAFSPDGRRFAFARWFGFNQSDLYICSLDRGEPQRLTQDNREIYGVAWTPDGRDLVFSSNRFGGQSLWRVSANASLHAQAERLAGVEGYAHFPAISRRNQQTPARLAYERNMDDVNIWRAEAPAAMAHTMKPGSQIIASTRTDIHPQYSWDGKRIVFVSDRDGTYELWMCAADGSNPVQLTSFGGHRPGPPHWSPDSQQVVFDLDTPGSYDVYVVGTDGGGPRRLTERGWRPSWSHDGRWIYFCSDRSSSSQQRFTDGTQIWKIPVERDEAVQVTKGGGCEPVESPDGKTLFFQRGRGHLALWSMPGSTDAEGGSETPILPSVLDGYWAVADQGVYFISPKHWAVPFPVLFFSFETRRATQIGTIGKDLPVDPSFSVTPDGHWIIWAQVDRSESDLMLVENFQ